MRLTRIAIPLLATLLLAPAASAARSLEMEIHLHELQAGLHIIPEEINAAVGDTLKITVYNDYIDHMPSPHDVLFCGDGTNPSTECKNKWAFTGLIQGNQTAQLTVPVKKAGTFDYYCDIPGHKAAGMSGLLRVQGDGSSTGRSTTPGVALVGTLIALAAVAVLRRR